MSAYYIEYDPSVRLEKGIWGRRLGVIEISEAVGTSKAGPAFQTVYNNGKLVESVFDYRKSHFSVDENSTVFRWHTLDQNFELLRQMCSLWNPKTEHVSSLITWFSLTDEYEKEHSIEDITKSTYKSTFKVALLLYWLAEWSDSFKMDDSRRQFLWDFFGHEICDAARKIPGSEFTLIRYLLNEWWSKVTIIRPWDPKQNNDEKSTN